MTVGPIQGIFSIWFLFRALFKHSRLNFQFLVGYCWLSFHYSRTIRNSNNYVWYASIGFLCPLWFSDSVFLVNQQSMYNKLKKTTVLQKLLNKQLNRNLIYSVNFSNFSWSVIITNGCTHLFKTLPNFNRVIFKINRFCKNHGTVVEHVTAMATVQGWACSFLLSGQI